jgi:hypothetical protein
VDDFLFDPTDAEKAAAMAAALRRQQNLGLVAQLSGDNVLTGVGNSLLQNSGRMQDMLANAGQQKAQRSFQEMMQGNQQAFQGGENSKNRSAEWNRLQAELGARSAADKAKAEAGKADATTGLRKEFSGLPEVKSFKEVKVAFDKIGRAARDPSPAGDLSLIFSYMKVLDPGSTVREGEFANAQNATSVPGQIINQYNRMLKGERLAPEMRTDFVNQAGNLFQSHASQYSGAAKKYRGLAEKGGLTPDDVADEFVSEQAGPAKVASDADFEALPSGSQFIGPDGQIRQKP